MHCKVNTLNAVIDTFTLIENQLGLKISYDKTVLYRIGSLANSDARLYTAKEFKWTNDTFPLLGIDISEDVDTVRSYNYAKTIQKMEGVVNVWADRQLTWMGKALIVNSLMESLFVYKLHILPNLTTEQIAQIEKLVKKFYWGEGGGRGRTKLSMLQKGKNFGGLRLFDIRIHQAALKANWIWKSQKSILFKHLLYNTWRIPNSLYVNRWCLNIHVKHAHLVLANHKLFWYEVCHEWFKFNFSEPLDCAEILAQPLWYNSNLMTGKVKGIPTCLYNNKCINSGVLTVMRYIQPQERQVFYITGVTGYIWTYS